MAPSAYLATGMLVAETMGCAAVPLVSNPPAYHCTQFDAACSYAAFEWRYTGICSGAGFGDGLSALKVATPTLARLSYNE